jgi:hypothetical protein
VSAVDGLGQPSHQLRRLPPSERPGLGFLLQGAAVHQLQGHVGAALAGAQVTDAVIEDLDDVGVFEQGHGLGLGLETGPFLGTGLAARQDDLQRHRAVEAHLEGAVHDAHAAPAQLVEQYKTGHRRRLGRRRRDRPRRRGQRGGARGRAGAPRRPGGQVGQEGRLRDTRRSRQAGQQAAEPVRRVRVAQPLQRHQASGTVIDVTGQDVALRVRELLGQQAPQLFHRRTRRHAPILPARGGRVPRPGPADARPRC